MSLYNELMEIVITENSIEEYKNRMSLQEGLFQKFLNKLSPAKKAEADRSKKYNEYKEQFAQNYKLTQEMVSFGFDIFSVIKSVSDFNKFVSATETSLSKTTEEFILHTYIFAYNLSENTTKQELIKHITDLRSKVNDSSLSNLVKEAYKDQIEFINKCDKLIPLNGDSFYCISNKTIYSIDYKGRIESTKKVKEYLEDELDY